MGHQLTTGNYNGRDEGDDSAFVEDPYSTFLNYGYYLKRISKTLWVFSINTLVWARLNDLAGSCDDENSDGYKHLAWMQENLENIKHLEEKQNEKHHIMLLGHVTATPAFFKEKCYNKYAEITKEYSSLIVGHFYGHTHQEFLRPIYGMTDSAYGVIYLQGA